MVTKIARVIFALLGLLCLVFGLLPTFRGQSMNTQVLSTGAVLLLLALGLRPRKPRASPPGPAA